MQVCVCIVLSAITYYHLLMLLLCMVPNFLIFLNSLSLFDFQRHGNRNYGSPLDSVKDMRSSQGKMEKSLLRYISFQYHIYGITFYLVVCFFWGYYRR